jgi:hypothetical protein
METETGQIGRAESHNLSLITSERELMPDGTLVARRNRASVVLSSALY